MKLPGDGKQDFNVRIFLPVGQIYEKLTDDCGAHVSSVELFGNIWRASKQKNTDVFNKKDKHTKKTLFDPTCTPLMLFLSSGNSKVHCLTQTARLLRP